jgi:formylglycine-generating enzyme required for sulfatase activity
VGAVLLLSACQGASEKKDSITPLPVASAQVIVATPYLPATATPKTLPQMVSTAAVDQGAPADDSNEIDSQDDFIVIPAGEFLMGNDKGDEEDKPAHHLSLPEYSIQKYEVTNAQFSIFSKESGYQTYQEKNAKSNWKDFFKPGQEENPVVMITWDDAEAYCKWLGGRLPGEAEWEKAARGSDGRAYPWGNEWQSDKANTLESGLRGPARVGSFGAGKSPYGVMDMAGNVSEWTADVFSAYPGNSNPMSEYLKNLRVVRGGGWFDDPDHVTTFTRDAALPGITAGDDLGFRCVKD